MFMGVYHSECDLAFLLEDSIRININLGVRWGTGYMMPQLKVTHNLPLIALWMSAMYIHTRALPRMPETILT